MGENPAYRLRGVEVKEVSHRATNAIKHNPTQMKMGAKKMQNMLKNHIIEWLRLKGFLTEQLMPLSKALLKLSWAKKDAQICLRTHYRVVGVKEISHRATNAIK